MAWSRRCAACPASASSRRSGWPGICCSTTATARAGSPRRCRRGRSIRHCERCHTFTEARSAASAPIPSRDARQLCVVETPADQAALERTGSYRGLYFVLMGRLSPLDGIGPRDIGAEQLLERASDGGVEEVIVATNFTAEGEATAHVLAEALKLARRPRHAARARCADRQRTRVRRPRHDRARACRSALSAARSARHRAAR